MKVISRIFVAAALLIALVLGVLWGSYAGKRPMSLPYFDGKDPSWSTFYTRFYMDRVPLDLERFQKQEPWLSAALAAETRGALLEELTYSQLQKLSGAQVVLDIEAGGGRALVVTGDLNGGFKCLALKYRSDEGGYDLVDSSGLTVHEAAKVITKQCNQAGEFSVQNATFYDFVFYDVLRCFSFCSAKDGVVFIDQISGEKENRFLKTIRVKLAADEEVYHSAEKAPEDVEVAVDSVIASHQQCFVRFVYVNPALGKVHKYAQFDCDSEELLDLKELGHAGGVAYYFFTLWPLFG